MWRNEEMSDRELPKYAVFDDFRYSQRIAVVVRWFLLVTWFFLHNYRAEPSEPSYFINNGLAAVLSVFNGYVHWRIWRGRPVSKRYVVALSAMDLSLITIGIAVSSRFGNTFFVLYYPALLGLSVVFPSRRVAFTAVVTVAVAYAGVSFLITPPGVAIAPRQVTEVVEKEEKVLLIRLAAMFAVVAAGNLITRVERDRRREAVEAERARAEENLELQKRAREAELDVVADVGDSRLVLQEAELSRPDVTLMDVRMPGIDGIETCRMLKQSMPEASVVMLTSFSDEKAVMASIMAGASGYLAQEHSSRGARVRRTHGRQRGVAAGPRRCRLCTAA